MSTADDPRVAGTQRTLRARLLAGEPLYGMLAGLASPAVAEMAALAGYDFVVIDGEHGPADRVTSQSLAQAIRAGGASAVLRAASHADHILGQALDLGVDGVMVPNIVSATQARGVVRAVRYPPAGARSNGTAVARASGYGLFARDYVSQANHSVLLAVMIESAAGASAAADIAAVEGVDAVMLGVYDLSGDLGIAGQFHHPLFLEAVDRVETAVRAAGKILAGVVRPDSSAAELADRGYRMVTLGTDAGALAAGMQDQLGSRPR